MIKQHDVGRWFSVRTVTMIIIMLLFSVDVTRGYLPYAVNHHLHDTFAVLPFMQTNAFYMKAIEFAVLCFFSDAPFNEKREMYYMVRCGKAKWAWRKYLYIVGSGLGCALVLLLVSVLVLLPAGKFSNTWGELVRTISVDNSAIGAFFSADAAILNQFTPLNLLIYVLLIDTLAFAMIGMMAFVFSMLWGRKVGYMITIVIIYMPTIVLRYMGKFVFFSPFSWLDMNFWRTGYDLEKPSLVYIVAMQLLCHVLLGVIGMIQLQRADWKEEEEA